MSTDPDLLLKSLLAAPERAPDESFALRIERLVLIEERLRAARRAAWARFGAEMLATASLLVAYFLLSSASLRFRPTRSSPSTARRRPVCCSSPSGWGCRFGPEGGFGQLIHTYFALRRLWKPLRRFPLCNLLHSARVWGVSGSEPQGGNYG